MKDRQELLNYLLCRCMDIEFYSNEAVFQTEFDGVKHGNIIENLTDTQKQYLGAIYSCIKQIKDFIEDEYVKELKNES